MNLVASLLAGFDPPIRVKIFLSAELYLINVEGLDQKASHNKNAEHLLLQALISTHQVPKLNILQKCTN